MFTSAPDAVAALTGLSVHVGRRREDVRRLARAVAVLVDAGVGRAGPEHDRVDAVAALP